MNPITSTVAASCIRFPPRSPLSSPRLSPRSKPWHSPVIAHTFSKNLTLPGDENCYSSGRRGSHDKRDLFAYSEKTTTKKHTKDKKVKYETKSTAQATANKTKAAGPPKKRLKEVAIEIKEKDERKTGRKSSAPSKKKIKKDKKCILM